jgi:outer membrane protein assembly factor BamB
VEKWRCKLSFYSEGGPAIDSDGTIYVAGGYFFAIYPNGTLKWIYDIKAGIDSIPVIDRDGTIYIGTINTYPNNYLYAIFLNGTLKWRYSTGSSGDIHSSPTIGNDGIIYFGDENAYINALYANGTLRWKYHTSGAVLSSPAIGNDGTIYCGSHDRNLYALYPNNGTMKWKFGTEGWVRTAPCIAEDGTIYCVSLDNYLYAVYPNGTMKWRTFVNAGTSPTIGLDGTIYAGWDNLYAVNPINGSVKWVFNPGPNQCIEGGTPCHSLDGTIYFGTRIQENSGGEIIAVNPNGTERWRKLIANIEVQSAPAIGEDGTLYIGSSSFEEGIDTGYLHAFGPGEPKKIEIEKPEPGKLYLFGVNIGSTLLHNTIILGFVNVKVKVYSQDQLESVNFYIDNIIQSRITEPPYEWWMVFRYGRFFISKHTITAIGYYKGGYTWSESIDVLYFHLLK